MRAPSILVAATDRLPQSMSLDRCEMAQSSKASREGAGEVGAWRFLFEIKVAGTPLNTMWKSAPSTRALTRITCPRASARMAVRAACVAACAQDNRLYIENAKTDLAARTQALAAAQADLDAKTQAYDAARNEADKAKQSETDAETAVRNAQQALTDAQARLAKAKSDAKDTEAVKTAQAKVKEAQDALDQAKTILAKAQADLKQAQTVEAQAKSDYETAKAALKTAQQAANPKHDDNAGQTSLNAAQQATVEAAAKADKVMASTGADTNGIILAVVAFAGMGAATLDLKRRRMDVTARHGMR